MAAALHYDGYESTVEEACPVRTFHRAECDLCEWESEEFDDLDWTWAEEKAVEHFDEEHAPDDEEDDEEDDEDA